MDSNRCWARRWREMQGALDGDGGAAPRPGDAWRINFSRVQWRHNHERLDAAGARVLPTAAGDGSPYAKRAGLPEDNWVWTPQWAIDMHIPRHWGTVTFVR